MNPSTYDMSALRLVRELESRADNTDVLADLRAGTAQLVHVDEHVVEQKAEIVAEIPVQTQRKNFLLTAANAPHDRTRRADLAGIPTDVQIAVARRDFPSAPAAAVETERRADMRVGEGRHPVVQGIRLIGLAFSGEHPRTFHVPAREARIVGGYATHARSVTLDPEFV